MKPIIKYQGGKTKELPLIKQLLPSQFSRVVEPFCGGAAVSFGLGYPALMSDINRDVINLYSVVANAELYPQLQLKVDYLKGLGHDDLKREFYASREVINQPWDCVDQLQRALSYIIVRQLCFSGMERYNSDGKFNVPYGHYKRLSCNLTPDHHRFLKNCDVRFASFDETLSSVNDDDFVFIDPPYLDRLGYTKGDGGFELHSKLHSILSEVKAPWMIIHSDHEFYREYYKDFNITDKNFAYAQRFGKEKKDSRIVGETLNVFELIGESDEIEMERPLERDHSGAKVGHLYITNY